MLSRAANGFEPQKVRVLSGSPVGRPDRPKMAAPTKLLLGHLFPCPKIQKKIFSQ